MGGDLLPTGSIRLRETPTDVTALPLWGEGNYWVQDGAAALPARLLDAKRGEAVLDMCAAPGGKTMQLAATGARVTALDVDSARINKVAENLARTSLTAHLMVADARQFETSESFDAVLLDAPCSATGTLRRNPEALWIKTPSDVARFAQTQAELMAAGAKALKPGGRLVYAVCSLEPEEAQSGIHAASEAGLVVSPINPQELPELEHAITPEGYVRLLPSYWGELGGMDGFFIARFKKP